MLRDRIAKRYAKSLFDLAAEQNLVEEAKADMEMLDKMLDDARELRLMLLSPLIREYKKIAIFKKIFDGKLHKITSLFIDLLMKHGREELIPEITGEFLEIYNKAKNITIVKVVSAQPLSTEDKRRIEQSVETMLKTNARLIEKVEPALIGGFVLKIGTKLYDASVLNSLRKLRKQINAGVV